MRLIALLLSLFFVRMLAQRFKLILIPFNLFCWIGFLEDFDGRSVVFELQISIGQGSRICQVIGCVSNVSFMLCLQFL